MKKTNAADKPRRFPLIRKILLVILALILIVVIVIAIFSAKNVKAMDKTVDAALSAIASLCLRIGIVSPYIACFTLVFAHIQVLTGLTEISY